MDTVILRPAQRQELEQCLRVIHESFRTVALEFGLTPENCPKHTAFLPMPYLQTQFDWGWKMFALWAGSRIIGYVSVSKKSDQICQMHHLAVLPEYRRRGCGELLVEKAKAVVRELGASRLEIGIIEESTVLKNWYIRQGFVPTHTKKFDHLPFTSGYLVWEA